MSSTGQIHSGVVGGLIGAVTPVGPFVGAQIGLTLGALLDPPKGPIISGPRIADLSVQTSAYGTSIPRIYGICIVTGNVFWIENNRLKETVTKKKSGGKGGPKTTTKTYSYSATFAVGFCEGPIVGVLRIWVGPNLIYHAGSTDQQTIIASNEAAEGFRLYLEDEEQLPDPRMQAALGVYNTPAFRGLAYIVFDDFQLEKYGNTMSGAQVKVEVMRSGSLYTYVATRHDMPSSHQYAVTAYGNGFFVRLAHFRRQFGSAPVARLLRLGQVDPDQFAHDILQAEAGGIGAGQFRGDLGAIDRTGFDPEMQLEHAYVEPAEMEQLQDLRIGQQPLQVRAVIARAVHAHDMGVAVPGRQLHHAERITPEAQPHGLGFDGDFGPEIEAVGQVAFVEEHRHS